MKGFTLIELLLVIVVLAVLATGIIMFINPAKRIKQAADVRVKHDIGEIATALESYYTLSGQIYPPDLNDLVDNEDIKSLPKTPSGDNYNYQRSNPCSISSCTAVVFFALRDPKVADDVWCWRSQTGRAEELALVNCAP